MATSKSTIAPASYDWLNKTQLHVMTKISTTKIKRIIESNISDIPVKDETAPTLQYKASAALKFLYMDMFGVSEDDFLDERQTRAQLNVEQRRSAEIRNEIMLKKLIHADELEEHWADILTKVRVKMLTLPVIVATQCVGMDKVKALEGVAREVVNTALTELSADIMPEIDYDTINESEVTSC